MRVLHVVHSLDQRYGGPLRAVLDLSARSISFGLDAEVLGFGPLSIPDNPFPLEKIHQLKLGFPRRYKYAPELQSWVKLNLSRFDGVILHGMWLYPNWALVKACRLAGIPYVCFPHGMLEPWALYGQGPAKAIKKTVYWLLRERAMFRRASAVFFTTERERTLAQRAFSLPPSTFIVVPYGVGNATASASTPARCELGISAERKVALFLGRVHPKKNVEFLMRAWAAANLNPHWSLIIAGPCEPAYRRTLDRLALSLKIQSRVHFVGSVSGQDKQYLLGRVSWFLLPSKQENFGISVLEAVNAGCPVAISDQVYLADYFHEKAEVLPLRLDAWTEFLRDRMPDEGHRDMLIQLDRKYVFPRFSIEVVARSWATTITSVLAEAARSRNN